MSRKRKQTITFIQRAPGKKGKQEYRQFKTLAEAQAFIERNQDRLHNVSAAEQIGRKL